MGDLRPLIKRGTGDDYLARIALESLCDSSEKHAGSGDREGRRAEMQVLIHNLYREVARVHRERVRELDEMARLAQEYGCGLVYTSDLTRAWLSDQVPAGNAVIFDPSLITVEQMQVNHRVLRGLRTEGWDGGPDPLWGGRRGGDPTV